MGRITDKIRTEEDLAFVLNELTTIDDPKFILRNLESYPTGDAQVRARLEALLDNDTPCLTSIPYSFGEMRYLAGHALAAERYRAGLAEPVRLHGVIPPLDTNELGLLAEQAGIRTRGGMEGKLEQFARLRERDLLPRYDIDMTVSNGYVKFDKYVQTNSAILPDTSDF